MIYKTALAMTTAFMALSSGAAYAETSPTYAISAMMNELGVSSQDQESILRDLALGILPESERADSIPTSSTVTTLEGKQVVIFRYADGSAKRLTRELPSSPLLRGTSLSACKQYAYTGYTKYIGCAVKNETLLVTMQFISDFTIFGGIYNDQINRAYSTSFICRGGTCSDVSLALEQPNETLYLKANARMSLAYTILGGWGTSTYNLDLYVGSDKATVVG